MGLFCFDKLTYSSTSRSHPSWDRGSNSPAHAVAVAAILKGEIQTCLNLSVLAYWQEMEGCVDLRVHQASDVIPDPCLSVLRTQSIFRVTLIRLQKSHLLPRQAPSSCSCSARQHLHLHLYLPALHPPSQHCQLQVPVLQLYCWRGPEYCRWW
jgi:hypothetical protein